MSAVSKLVEELRGMEKSDSEYCEWKKKEILKEAADTIESFFEVQEKNTKKCLANWVKCSDRLPTMEECQKNDCRFIVDDGNRRYQCLFDYEEKIFIQFNCIGVHEDKCAVRWCELPDPPNKN